MCAWEYPLDFSLKSQWSRNLVFFFHRVILKMVPVWCTYIHYIAIQLYTFIRRAHLSSPLDQFLQTLDNVHKSLSLPQEMPIDDSRVPKRSPSSSFFPYRCTGVCVCMWVSSVFLWLATSLPTYHTLCHVIREPSLEPHKWQAKKEDHGSLCGSCRVKSQRHSHT